MTAANELDAILCQEDLPDEFCRFTSSSSSGDKPSMASMLSGIVPVCEQDVMCPLMLRRHLVVPAWRGLMPTEMSL